MSKMMFFMSFLSEIGYFDKNNFKNYSNYENNNFFLDFLAVKILNKLFLQKKKTLSILFNSVPFKGLFIKKRLFKI